MKISTKGRYALRMMLDLAQNQGDSYVALKSVSERQNISKKYLEQIVPALNNAGLLKANRGYKGGYRLARSTEDYTVGEILTLTEGGLAPVSCLNGKSTDCSRSYFCPTLPVWKGLEKVITNYLYSVTLKDILDQQIPEERNGGV